MKKNILWLLVVVAVITGIVGYKWINKNDKIESNDDIGSIYELKDKDISKLLGRGKPVIINFTASWCIACKTFNPLLEKTYERYKDQVIIKIIDADENKDIVRKFPVRAIPTQLLFNKDGSAYDASNVGILGFRGYSKNNTDEVTLTVHEGAISEDELLKVLKDMGVDIDD